MFWHGNGLAVIEEKLSGNVRMVNGRRSYGELTQRTSFLHSESLQQHDTPA